MARTKRTRRPTARSADAILNNLMEAVGWILRSSLALIGALRGRTVAVIGDVVADEFVYGRVARVSREAPVLILEYDSTEIVPGGAGNAANNVARARRPRAALVGVVGRDEPGRRLLGVAAPRASTSAGSSARRRAARRSRRGSSPAASIPPSSRSCASIARVGNSRSTRDSRAQFERAALARIADGRRGAASPTTAPAW